MNTRIEKMKATRERWRELVNNYKTSGQDINEYCSQREITRDSLKRWDWRLRAEERIGYTPGGMKKEESSFIEIRPEKQKSTSLELRYTVVLRNRRELRIEGNNLELKQLIAELEQC